MTPLRPPVGSLHVDVSDPERRTLPAHDSPRGLLHHLEINVADLERSIAFWDFLLGWFGYRPFQEWDEGTSWRLGATYLALVVAPDEGDGFSRRTVGLNHLAFHAESPAEVDELVTALGERGVELLYADRHPFAGGPDHYAAFFEDPDGLKIEVVADRS